MKEIYVHQKANFFIYIPMLSGLYFYYPYVTTLFICACAAFLALSLRSQSHVKIVNYFVISVFLTTISCFIASKSSLNIIGNDRYQYFNYLYSFDRGFFFDVISIQPELFSFGILNLLSKMVGINNWVFYLFFMFSFLILLLGVRKFDDRVLPLFILTFLCSSAFYVLYGNIIRQGLAVSFFVFAYFSGGLQRKLVASFMVLSHLAFLVYVPLLLFDKKIIEIIDKSKWYFIPGVFLACVSLSFLFPYFFELIKFVGIQSFERKVELYLNWKDYDALGALTSTFIIAFLTFLLSYLDKKTNLFHVSISGNRKTIALAVSYTLCLAGLVSSNNIIFNRFYSVLILLFVLYFWVCVYSLKNKYIRTLTVLSSVIILAILNAILISKYDLFYKGEPLRLLSDSILTMYSVFQY